MGVNTSASMNLPIPQVGNEDGPQYSTDVNSCLTIVDGHNHAPGLGVQISPNGMDINADLPFNGNNLTLARSVRFSPQLTPISGPSDLGCLYESGVDLFYNDGSGNIIRLTQSGGIAGTPGSISGLTPPASVTYVSGDQTFVFQSAANTAGNIDAGFYILRNSSANSFGLTLEAPTLAGDYSLTLPQLPPQQNFMTLDSSGIMSAPWNVDNVTLQITSNLLNIKAIPAGSIGTPQIADGSVTLAKLAPLSYQLSGSSGNFGTSSASPVAVTNLSVTITCTGKPIFIAIVGDNNGSLDSTFSANGTNSAAGRIAILRGVTELSSYVVETDASGAINIVVPPCMQVFDVPGAGTFTYSVVAEIAAAASTTFLRNVKLLAYEI